MKRKETYLSRDFRETAALRFPARAKELNTAFDMRLSALLAENVGASKEKQYHLKRQILPGIAAYETLQRVMPKEDLSYGMLNFLTKILYVLAAAGASPAHRQCPLRLQKQ